ncbi:MAG: hypothetical protein AAFZ58_06230 [Pseudomonadota bacterium]
MGQILNIAVQLVLFRGTPASLPASSQLLLRVIAVYLILSTVVVTALYGGPLSLLSSIMVSGVVYGGLALLLIVNNRQERLTQAMIALLVVDILISLLQFPVLLVLQPYSGASAWAWLGFLLWLLGVHSRIVGAALDWNPALAGVFVLLITATGLYVGLALLPPPPDTASLAPDSVFAFG